MDNFGEKLKNSLKRMLSPGGVKKQILKLKIAAIGAGIFLVFVAAAYILELFKIDISGQYGETSPHFDEGVVLYGTMYQRYSDQSYYYQLSEPTEEDIANEVENYSGKNYEDLNGLKEKKLTQASYNDNYVEDVDGYEEAVKVSATVLKGLDIKLNYESDAKIYFPEQFVKAVYVGTSCDLTADDLDINTCELGDLKDSKPLSVYKWNEEKNLYELDEEETAKRKEELKTEIANNASNGSSSQDDESENSEEEFEQVPTYEFYDYGLGSLVHYQAYFQPSRINNYKVDTITYIDEDWKYGDSLEPMQTKTFLSLEKEEKDNIFGKYKYLTNEYSSSRSEGMLKVENNNNFGLYEVEPIIVYKDWANAYFEDETDKTSGKEYETAYKDIYTKNNGDIDATIKEWGKTDPYVSNGVAETTIGYAIDQAVTYIGKVDLNIEQNWVQMGIAENTQKALYVKDYQNNSKGFFEDYEEDLKSYNKEGQIETYKRLYAKNENDVYKLVGFIEEDPEWHEGYFETDKKHHYSKTCYDANRYNNCVNECGEDLTCANYCSGDYDCSYDLYSNVFHPGYWTYKLIKDADFNDVNGSETIVGTKLPNIESGEKEYSALQEWKKEYNKDSFKNDKHYNWQYEPTFLYTVIANTTGKNETYLVSHSGASIDTPKGALDYIKTYVKEYKAFFATSDTERTYGCYTSSNYNSIHNDKPGSLITNANMLSGCGTNSYVLASDNSLYMNDLGLGQIPNVHLAKIRDVLGFNINQEHDEVEYSSQIIETSKLNNDALIELEKVTTGTYKKAIETWSEKFGIDSRLLASLVVTSQDANNLTGVHTDNNIANETLEDVKYVHTVTNKNEDDERFIVTETITIPYSSVAGEEQIKFAAAKLQKLFEKYDGNILLGLLEYNLGSEGTEKVLEIFEEQTGIPKDYAIEDIYETGWYHFVPEVIKNSNKYGVTINTGASKDFVGNVIYNAVYSSFIWTRKNDDGSNSAPVWNAVSLKDSCETKENGILELVGEEYYSQFISSMYYLKKDNASNFEENWDILTAGQKAWDSAVYIKEDENGEPLKYDSTKKSAYFDYVENETSAVSSEAMVAAVMGVDPAAIDTLPDSEWVKRMGFLVVAPSYEEVLNTSSLKSPVKKITESPIKYDADIGGEVNYWLLMTDSDEKIYNITDNGVVTSVGYDTVVVNVNEEKRVDIIYEGLKNINVEVGDIVGAVSGKACSDNQEDPYLGLSTNKLQITIEEHGEHIKYYNMREFFDNYESKLSSSTQAFLRAAGFLGTSTLSESESAKIWSEIENNLQIAGCSMAHQCTEFTNWMVQQHWGERILEAYGSYLPVAGNGDQKVKCLSEVYGAILTDIKYGLSDFGDSGSNIAFSWEGGLYGHTGWIDEYKVGEFVIVSQGNVNGGLISWQHKYTWDQWQSTYADGSRTISYIGLSDTKLVCDKRYAN